MGAYQYLLDYHLSWYLEHPTRQTRREIYQGKGGQWFLTTEEKKRILLNSIYGVDIDPQAVEVTKLSLLLKVLEGESQETIAQQLELFHERALPDLGHSIKCGNSLIGPDFYAEQQASLFDQEEALRINAFDWQKEFTQVFQGGGFDVVIGNPPYIRIHNMVDFYPDEVRFIQHNYQTAGFGKVDIYVAFIEKGLEVLTNSGRLGFIVPNKFMTADYGVGLRKLLSNTRALVELVDFGNAQVFEQATTYTCLLFLASSPKDTFRSRFNRTQQSPIRFLEEAPFEERQTEVFGESPWQLASSLETRLLQKIEKAQARLSDVIQLAITGVKTGANNIFVFEAIERKVDTIRLRPEDAGSEVELETEYLVPYLKAESLKRYHVGSGSRVLLYPYQLSQGQTRLVPESQIRSCVRTWQYLLSHRHTLEGRQKGKLKGPSWYGLSFASSLDMFSATKIVTPTLAPKNSFALDTGGNLFPQGAGGGCGLVPKDEYSDHYLLGLLNSRLLTFYFQRISSPFQGGWYAYEPRYLQRLPIRTINFTDPADVAHHEHMVALAERMLSLHKQLAEARTPPAKTMLQRQIEATDQQIDRLVYELYGLTEEEIKIVEGKG